MLEELTDLLDDDWREAPTQPGVTVNVQAPPPPPTPKGAPPVRTITATLTIIATIIIEVLRALGYLQP